VSLPTIAADINAVQSISSVPTILEAVSAMTGLRFVCIAKVTPDSWTTCAVLDKLGFGLKVGDHLDVATTLCEEVRDTHKAVVIDNVSEDEKYRDHHTPRIYGFQSYISIPVFRPDGDYFGTLCALDPVAAKLSSGPTIASMTLFAQLITSHLDTETKLNESQVALLGERETSELREQFIAVLGHDLRTPLGSILLGTELLEKEQLSARAHGVVLRMKRSAHRMAGLVNDVVDFTRGKMGGGIALNVQHETALEAPLMQVVEELRGAHPDHVIEVDFRLQEPVQCDVQRIQQMLSNLLKNAIVYGDPSRPVLVRASSADGKFELHIVNHGPAISQATIDQLFKPFWRASAHASNEGLGLGLFIVSEIARSHGGELAVESSDAATRFTFRLGFSDAGARAQQSISSQT
jgi:signal transduction histidine kinase